MKRLSSGIWCVFGGDGGDGGQDGLGLFAGACGEVESGYAEGVGHRTMVECEESGPMLEPCVVQDGGSGERCRSGEWVRRGQ